MTRNVPAHAMLSIWIVAVLSIPSCGKATDKAIQTDSSVVVASRPTDVQHVDSSGRVHATPAHDSVLPGSVSWNTERVANRLKSAGLRIDSTKKIVQPFLSAGGTVFHISGGIQVQAFFYGDALSRARDSDALDPVRVAPPTMQITWIQPVRLVVDNNLLAIVLGPSRAVIDQAAIALRPQ